jgi:hypothetical protein
MMIIIIIFTTLWWSLCWPWLLQISGSINDILTARLVLCKVDITCCLNLHMSLRLPLKIYFSHQTNPTVLKLKLHVDGHDVSCIFFYEHIIDVAIMFSIIIGHIILYHLFLLIWWVPFLVCVVLKYSAWSNTSHSLFHSHDPQ